MGDHQHLHVLAPAAPAARRPRRPWRRRCRQSTSSNTRVAASADRGQHHLQRQHEARQLAARGDLGDRRRRRAGIGRDLELHAVGAVLGPSRPRRSGVELGRERAPSRASAAAARPTTALSSRAARLARAPPPAPRPPRHRPRAPRLRLGAAASAPALAVVERRELRRASSRAAAGSSSTVDAVLARQRRAARTAAPRSSPARCGSNSSASRARLELRRCASASLAQRAVERRERRVEPARPPCRRCARSGDARRARRATAPLARLELAERLRHRFAERCSRCAAAARSRGELLLFVGLGASASSSFTAWRRIVLVAPRGAAASPRPRRAPRSASRQALPGGAHRVGLLSRARRRRRARRGGWPASSRPCCSIWPWISTSGSPSWRSSADRGRLVVDEGAAAAVGADMRRRISSSSSSSPCSSSSAWAAWSVGQLERGRDRWPASAPRRTRPRVAARAERQAERIEQDRFAGAGLAGQRARPHPAREVEVEPLDQHEVADRQARAACRPGQKTPKNQRSRCSCSCRCAGSSPVDQDSSCPGTSRCPGSCGRARRRSSCASLVHAERQIGSRSAGAAPRARGSWSGSARPRCGSG